MKKDTLHLSRTISHALRHEPWLYELELDDEGWVESESLLEALRAQRPEWRQLAEQDILQVMAAADKQRFELRSGRIRALYGHSTPQRLRKLSAKPPAVLYHGTSHEVAEVILTEGLRPMGRQYVHLSVDQKTAQQVARRKTQAPMILEIAAETAHAAGVIFYAGNAQVWLADHVPPAYMRMP